jgi:hypothetical protein
MRGEVQRVATAVPGCRNQTLNLAAYHLGRLVGGGELEREQAEQALFAAAALCGLVGDDGASAARATIASGLDHGALHPEPMLGVEAVPFGHNAAGSRADTMVAAGRCGAIAEPQAGRDGAGRRSHDRDQSRGSTDHGIRDRLIQPMIDNDDRPSGCGLPVVDEYCRSGHHRPGLAET